VRGGAGLRQSTKKLKRAGLVLLGLSGRFQSNLLGNLVFRLERMGASGKKKLPHHRFEKGDGVVLLRLGPDGELPAFVRPPSPLCLAHPYADPVWSGRINAWSSFLGFLSLTKGATGHGKL
jgi:hypothetical protein